MSVVVILANGNEEHIAEGRSIATADGVLFVYNGNTVDLGLIGIYPLGSILGARVQAEPQASSTADGDASGSKTLDDLAERTGNRIPGSGLPDALTS